MSILINDGDIRKIYNILYNMASKRYRHQLMQGVLQFKQIMSFKEFRRKFDVDESILITSENPIAVEIDDFANNPDFSMLLIPEAYDEALMSSMKFGETRVDWSDNLTVSKVLLDIKDFIENQIKIKMAEAFRGDSSYLIIPSLEVKRNFTSNLESVTIIMDVNVLVYL